VNHDELAVAMKARGMLSVDERMEPSPLDHFMTNIAVTSLESLARWVDRELREQYTIIGKLMIDNGYSDTNHDELDWNHGQVYRLREFKLNLQQVIDNAKQDQ